MFVPFGLKILVRTLVASDECGCVTVWELFEGDINFLQLKRALA